MENNSSELENNISKEPESGLSQKIFKKKNKILFWSLGIIFFVYFVYFIFGPPGDFPVGSVFKITQGETLHHLSFDLKKEHIIRSRTIFEALVIFYGSEFHMNYSDYLLEKKLSVFELASRFALNEKHLAPIVVTIREGLNREQMAELFSLKLSNFNKANFLTKTQNLEGYLFPDTYFFVSTDDENDVIKLMQDNFNKKVVSIFLQMQNSKRTENQILTMASIIELEAKGDLDRALIAGILWKRLDIGMPLQVDADMETYKNKGLPKNPLNNPGILAIKAAMYPENSNYLYYLHDKDGTAHYAKTFAEHRKNKIKYLSTKNK